MSEIEYKSIALEEIFDFDVTSNGSILTKTFVQKNKGNIPVYGSTMIENEVSYDYIKDNVEGIKYFDDCLTINRNGSAGYLFYRKGRFCINSDVTPLVLYDKYEGEIDLNYIKWVLEPITTEKFSHNRKAGKSVLKPIKILIPVNAEGKFDFEMQKELARKYQIIEEQKQVLREKIKELEKIAVVLPRHQNVKWAYPRITDLFCPQGGNSEYTKKWASENMGDIPLYSGATSGVYASVNRADYDGEFLTWVKDGLAGYIMYHREKFCITCHRGVLIPTDKCINIDLRYIKYVLEPIFRSKKKGREGDFGKNEYTSLSPSDIKSMKKVIPIPMKEDGTYDIDKQKEFADKYEQIGEIKQMLINRITELIEVAVI